MKYSLTAVFGMLVFVACASPEPAVDRDGSGAGAANREGADDYNYSGVRPAPEDMEPLDRLLFESRSRLSDLYASLSHDMPESYLQSDSVAVEEVDIYAGFRIQLVSTRDIAAADTLKKGFDAWADSTFQPVQPYSYIFFRQPYYRVRIGDFHDRNEAVALSRVLKNHYPESWVVHDRINPERVLPDTLHFQLRAQNGR